LNERAIPTGEQIFIKKREQKEKKHVGEKKS